MPLIGEKMPEMEVKTTKGIKHLPTDYKGKWYVLFSHPGDFTPVCTTEFVAFQKRYDQFRELDTELIGLSIDQVFSHMKWVESIEEHFDEKIEFPIIADDMGKVSQKLGMIHPAKGTNTVRAVFIVDDKGKLRATIYYPQEVGRNVDEILRTVKALQTSDKNKVAMPHNWPKNELLDDKVIIEPASSDEEKEKRYQSEEDGEIECKDWWFCYKDL